MEWPAIDMAQSRERFAEFFLLVPALLSEGTPCLKTAVFLTYIPKDRDLPLTLDPPMSALGTASSTPFAAARRLLQAEGWLALRLGRHIALPATGMKFFEFRTGSSLVARPGSY